MIKEVQDYIVDELAALNLADFLSVMRRVLDRRNAGVPSQDGERKVHVLAAVSIAEDDGQSASEEAASWAVAYVDEDVYGAYRGGDDDMGRYGYCGNCQISVVSLFRNAICPVCGRKVECT